MKKVNFVCGILAVLILGYALDSIGLGAADFGKARETAYNQAIEQARSNPNQISGAWQEANVDFNNFVIDFQLSVMFLFAPFALGYMIPYQFQKEDGSEE